MHFQQTRPTDGYVVQFCKQYFDRLYIYIYQRVYRRLPRRDQGIVYKIWPLNRHLSTFAERCINNRTIRHDMKVAVPIVNCYRKMHLYRSKSRAVYSIPLCLITDGALIWGRCQKFVSGLIIMDIWQVGQLLRWGLRVVPAIIYHCNVVLVPQMNLYIANWERDKSSLIGQYYTVTYRRL